MADLYSDRMMSVFGMGGATSSGNNSPVRNLRVTAETLMNMEQDSLDASHDQQDLLEENLALAEEQIKVLKKVHKTLQNMESSLAFGNASSVLDNITDVFGNGRGGRGGRGPGRVRRALGNMRGKVGLWAAEVAGGVTGALASTSRVVRSGTAGIYAKTSTAVSTMAGSITRSLGGLMSSVSSLVLNSVGKLGGFLTKVVAPAMAGLGALEGWNKINQLDPENKKGWMNKFDGSIAGGVDNLAFGLPSMITEYFYGKGFVEQMNQRNQDMEDLAKKHGLKTLGQHFDDALKWFNDKNTNNTDAPGTRFGKYFRNPAAAPETPTAAPKTRTRNTAPIKPFGGVESTVLPPAMTNPASVAAEQEITARTTVRGPTANLGRTRVYHREQIAANDRTTRAVIAGTNATVQEIKSTNRKIDQQTAVVAPTVANSSPLSLGDQLAGITTDQMGNWDPATGKPIVGPPSAGNPGVVMGNPQAPTSNQRIVGPGAPASAAVTESTGRVISTADTNLSVNQRALLDTIAVGDPSKGNGYWESPDYNTIVGGKKFSDFSKHPEVFGTATSTAAGRYQFTKTTWKDVVGRYNKQNPNTPITDFSPKSQDRAALFLAAADYKRRSGGADLMADLESGVDMGPRIKEYLGGRGKNTTWEIFQKKSDQQVGDAFVANQKRNAGYSTAPANDNSADSAKVAGVVRQRQDVLAGVRKQEITESLQKEIASNVLQTLGKDFYAEVYSGGQESKNPFLHADKQNRTGSTRHDGGKAGDLKLMNRVTGEQATQEQYATFAQNWLANKKGGIGLQMRGGGIHVDEHSDRAPYWDYDNKGGIRVGKNAKALIDQGLAGNAPRLVMSREEAEAYLKPTVPINPNAFSASIKAPQNRFAVPGRMPELLPTTQPMSDSILNKQGAAIAQGIVQAERIQPKLPSFDPSQQASSVLSNVEAPSKSQVADQPRGKTNMGSVNPDVTSIRHTDEFTMMLANGQMMA